MKVVQALVVNLLVVGTIMLCYCSGNGNSPDGPPKRKVIKLSYGDPANFASETHLTAWIFMNYVNDHSNNLEVKLYPSSALGQEREVYEAMQLGSGASCTISGTAILNNFSPRTGVLDLCFLWNDFDHVHRVLDSEVGEILSRDLDRVGFKVLAWLDSWGYRNVVTSKKEVTLPSQLKGLKVRTIQTPFYIEALNAMGANATPMAFGEIYTSMQTGVLDGFEHSPTVIKANKFYEVSKYMALTRHLFGPIVLVYGKKQWDALSQEDQQILQKAADLARDVQRALTPIREKQALQFLTEKGMILHEIDRSPFLEIARGIQDKLAKTYGAQELLAKIRAGE